MADARGPHLLGRHPGRSLRLQLNERSGRPGHRRRPPRPSSRVRPAPVALLGSRHRRGRGLDLGPDFDPGPGHGPGLDSRLAPQGPRYGSVHRHHRRHRSRALSSSWHIFGPSSGPWVWLSPSVRASRALLAPPKLPPGLHLRLPRPWPRTRSSRAERWWYWKHHSSCLCGSSLR